MSRRKNNSKTGINERLVRNASSLTGALLIVAPGLSLFFIDIEMADYSFFFFVENADYSFMLAKASVISGSLLITAMYFVRNQA